MQYKVKAYQIQALWVSLPDEFEALHIPNMSRYDKISLLRRLLFHGYIMKKGIKPKTRKIIYAKIYRGLRPSFHTK